VTGIRGEIRYLFTVNFLTLELVLANFDMQLEEVTRKNEAAQKISTDQDGTTDLV
jgi:hypothetical protein